MRGREGETSREFKMIYIMGSSLVFVSFMLLINLFPNDLGLSTILILGPLLTLGLAHVFGGGVKHGYVKSN